MSLQDDRRANFVAWMGASELNMSKVAAESGVSYNTIRSYVGDGTGKQTASLTGANEAKIAAAFNLSIEDIFGEMPGGEARPNHLRAWRVFREKTVDELAEKVGVPASNIELLELMVHPPSDKWLRRLAPALQTTPGFILDFDPTTVDTSALDAALAMVSGAPAPKRPAKRATKAA